MATKFLIGVNTAAEILSNPPPQFRHVHLIFTPFAVRVGAIDYPLSCWTDFAGVFLFQWYRAVLKLANGESRVACLPFWYTYEMWLRRTREQWWRLSLVERHRDGKEISHEALLIPEVVEAALLTAIQKLLGGARRVGVWSEDCVALDALLKGREAYLEELEAGRAAPPSFLSARAPVPVDPKEPMWTLSVGPPVSPPNGGIRPPRPDEGLPPAIQRRLASWPIFCPRCTAVLQPWGEKQTQQTCPLCGERITW